MRFGHFPIGPVIAVTSFLVGFSAAASAADPGPEAVHSAVRSFLRDQERAVLLELTDLVSIPNLARDAADIRRNADRLEGILRTRGISTERLEVEGSPPVVYGRLSSPGATRTIVLYAHYDGQPVDPGRWLSDPWDPVVRDPGSGSGAREIHWWLPGIQLQGDWRLYGRSTSDDKAPIVALLGAIDALRRARIPPSVNLKFFLEGEEEAGSPHLPQILERHADKLDGDLWLVCDGPVHQSGRMQVFFGARGIIGLEMTVYGALKPLHSGHYGNWAPNPIALLAHLLAGMRDPDGGIRIRGFSKEVRKPTKPERLALETVPDLRETLFESLGLAWSEGGGRALEELLMLPAMNLRGIQGGGVEERARNAIPTEARASIDFRLVPDQTPEIVRSRVEEHIRNQGFQIVYDAPDLETRRRFSKIVKLSWGPGYPPARTGMDLPASRNVIRVIEDALGGPIVKLPTLGGSGPLYLFRDLLGAPVVGVPIVNHDNNQHAPDENLRLQNLWDGVEIFAHIIARLGHVWE